MKGLLADRISGYVAVFGLLLAAAAFLVGGFDSGLAATVGAVIAVLNWKFLRWVGKRFMSGGQRVKNGMMLLLGLKLVGILAVCWLVLTQLDLEPLGFMAGLSAFVLGVFVGSTVEQSTSATQGEG